MYKRLLMISILIVCFYSNQHAKSTQEAFTSIYEHNSWGSSESVSGPGSTHHETQKIRQEIPLLFQSLNIATILDAPCGDFNWFKLMDLPTIEYYIGIDIVQDVISDNQQDYTSEARIFLHKNILEDDLPLVDLILCRDCLVHFPYKQIWIALRNFKKSGARYLLTTTFTGRIINRDLKSVGEWRTLNLQRPPFNFPEPLVLINEEIEYNNPIYRTKCLALWQIADLPIK